MISQEQFNFDKERSFKEIFSDAWLFIQQFGKEYVFLVFMYAAPLFALSAYFASQANIEIHASQQLFSSSYLWYSLLVDFFADVIVNGVTFSALIMFIQTGKIVREDVMTYFNQNFLFILGVTIVANVIISLGFILFIVPGIISLVPMSLFVFDRFLHKQSFEISFLRSFELTRSNIALSYGVIFLMYAVIFIVKFVFEQNMSVTSQQYIIVNTVFQTAFQILFSCSSIIIVLLYYSLFSKLKKRSM